MSTVDNVDKTTGEVLPSIPEQLDAVERDLPAAENEEIYALQAWTLEEARVRLELRALDESGGKRASCEDIKAQLTVYRSDPEHPIGRAWIAYNDARAKARKLKADYRTLHRANWKLTKSW